MALAAGADPENIIMHGNAKSDEEISMAIERRVGLIVIDGMDDINRLEALLPASCEQEILIRLKPGIAASTHRYLMTGHHASKFGLDKKGFNDALLRIGKSQKLRMRGVHSHIGSQITELESFVSCLAALAALGDFPVYDVGGGLGARSTYSEKPPSIDDYLASLVGAANELTPINSQLIVEPGRSVVAENAMTVYRVLTVKREDRTYVAVDGGLADNIEAAMYGQRFEAVVASRANATGGEQTVVVGRHCDSSDILIDGIALPHPTVGDLLVIPATGAYTYAMANNYNGARKIPIVFVSDGRHRMVARRQTWNDLLSCDVD